MNLLPKNGQTFYEPHFLRPEEATLLLQALLEELDLRQEPIWMFGRKVLQPRLTAWYGDVDKPYRYSGATMAPRAWTPSLQILRARAEALAQTEFTNVLVNLYRDGQDSMGWHRDNEKELGKNPVIASVSLGDQRDFLMRHRQDPSLRLKIPLNHGSLLIMAGETQHFWEHSLPKRRSAQKMRLNLTFRKLLEPSVAPC